MAAATNEDCERPRETVGNVNVPGRRFNPFEVASNAIDPQAAAQRSHCLTRDADAFLMMQFLRQGGLHFWCCPRASAAQ
jgi:hypothetical protein